MMMAGRSYKRVLDEGELNATLTSIERVTIYLKDMITRIEGRRHGNYIYNLTLELRTWYNA